MTGRPGDAGACAACRRWWRRRRATAARQTEQNARYQSHLPDRSCHHAANPILKVYEPSARTIITSHRRAAALVGRAFTTRCIRGRQRVDTDCSQVKTLPVLTVLSDSVRPAAVPRRFSRQSPPFRRSPRERDNVASTRSADPHRRVRFGYCGTRAERAVSRGSGGRNDRLGRRGHPAAAQSGLRRLGAGPPTLARRSVERGPDGDRRSDGYACPAM